MGDRLSELIYILGWFTHTQTNRLCVGKPSQYIAGHLGQLSLPSLRGIKYYRPVWLGLRRGGFTCVGWQVTL